jgi:hypothetical protein
MGVDWDDREKIAFGMLVTPDGRVVCQKFKHNSFISTWQATITKSIAKYHKKNHKKSKSGNFYYMANKLEGYLMKFNNIHLHKYIYSMYHSEL